jgi:hypothetical protein
MNGRGARLKLFRANEHFEALKIEEDRFRETKPYKIVRRTNDDGSEHSYRLWAQGEPRDEVSTVLGDAIHNMRSVLDHLAAAFAMTNRGKPSKCEWPIFDTKERFDAAGKVSVVKDEVSSRAWTLIKWSQPYRRRQRAHEHVIWMLHQLDNIDKHQRLHLMGIASEGTRVDGFPDIPQGRGETLVTIHRGPFKDGAEIVHVRFPEPHPEVCMNVTPWIVFGFSDAPYRGHGVVNALAQIGEQVTRLARMAERNGLTP